MTSPNIEVVYAVGRRVISTGNGSVLIPKGSHWPATDPIVQAHRDLFSTDPRWGMAYSVEPKGYDAPVGPTLEQAMAAHEKAEKARLAAEEKAEAAQAAAEQKAETATAAPGEKRAAPAGRRG